MVEMITFAAEARASRRQGPGPRAAARRQGAGHDLWRAQGPGDGLARGARAAPPARQPALLQHAVQLEVDGEAVRVLPREVQLHPVTDDPLHVDFLRVSARRHGRGRGAGGLRPRGRLARASSAAACSTSCAARSSWSARPTRSRASSWSTSPAVRHRRQRPHQPRRAAGRRAADDHRSRLHDRLDLRADRGDRGGGERRRRAGAGGGRQPRPRPRQQRVGGGAVAAGD